MKLNISGISYKLNDDGTTRAVHIDYNCMENNERISASVILLEDDGDLEELTKPQLDQLAKEKMVGWLKE